MFKTPQFLSHFVFFSAFFCNASDSLGQGGGGGGVGVDVGVVVGIVVICVF